MFEQRWHVLFRRKHNTFCLNKIFAYYSSISGVVVSMVAFQAVDPGLTPGWRKCSFSSQSKSPFSTYGWILGSRNFYKISFFTFIVIVKLLHISLIDKNTSRNFHSELWHEVNIVLSLVNTSTLHSHSLHFKEGKYITLKISQKNTL